MNQELKNKTSKGTAGKDLGAVTDQFSSPRGSGDSPYLPNFMVDLEPESEKDDWLWGPINSKNEVLAAERFLSLFSFLATKSGKIKVSPAL